MLVLSSGIYAQNGSSCIIAEPFCTGVTYAFPLGTNTTAEPGPNYGCLYTYPNPYWYFLKILDPGDITIHLSSGVDIDFACWGPFSSPTAPCVTQLTANCSGDCCPTSAYDESCCPNNTSNPGFWPCGNMVDCSYDMLPTEDVHISNAQTGEYYLLLITNYSNTAGNIVFSQSNNIGTPGVDFGTTDCSIVNPCDITNITVSIGACNPATNTYSINGAITYTDAPATGSLVVTVSGGGSQTINGPFTTSSSYNIGNLASDGASHTITATFSDDPFCTYTITFTAPNPCSFCFATAGADFSVCGLTTTLAAVANPTDISQIWSCAGTIINQLSNPNTSVIVPSAGTYIFRWTIVNSAGLTCYDEVSVTFNLVPTSTFTASGVACFTSPSTVQYNGNAPAGATYTWNFNGGTASPPGTGQGPHSVTWAAGGTYNITLTVTNGGCTSTQTSVPVIVPPQLQVSVNTSPVTCASGTNGQANVTVTGGTGAPVYTWSNGTGPPFAAGPYTVTVTDANLCTATTPFIISQPNSINVIPSQVNVSCYGASDGSATVTVSGGTSPYSYLWSNGGNTNTIINIPAGTYTVTIIDFNGCTTDNTIIITEPSVFTASVLTQNNPACQGVCNGSAAVQATGGMAQYTYAWPGGATTSTASGLCSGPFVVTITDSQGCTATTTVTLTDPPGVSVLITGSTNNDCYNQCTGTATALASGGTPGLYNYFWSTGSNNTTASSLCAGPYGVTASDVSGCTASVYVTITEPPDLLVSVGSEDGVQCYGDCNGQGSVDVMGGTPSYQYYWAVSAFNQQTNPNLCAGSHFVTVTDANGCTASTMVVIPGPSELVIQNVQMIPSTCNGTNDAQVIIDIQGGLGAFNYQLGTYSNTSGAFSYTFTGLSPGNYGITITDANYCTKVGSVTVTQPNPIVLASTPSFTLCNGQTGFIQTVVSGGSQPYIYTWNGVSGTSILQVNSQSQITYNIQVTDANGCVSNIASTTVDVTPPVQLEVIASPSAVCPGEPVMLNVNITSGAGEPYIVRYNDQIVVPPYTVYPVGPPGEYFELTVEDNCGSIASDTVLVTVYNPPQVTFTSDTSRGCQTLEVHFSQYSSVPGISYIWNFGDGSYDQISYDVNPYHKFRTPGVFDVTLTVTSVDGCVSTVTIPQMITVYPKPDSRFDAVPQIVSIIKPEIQFVNLSTLADWYIWHFGDGDSASIENPVHFYHSITTFNVTLIALTNMGCKDTSNLTVTVRDEYSFYAPSAFSPNNDYINDVFFVLGHGIDVSQFYLGIYDRWGMLMYETDKYNPLNPAQYGWKGTSLNNKMAPIGTYTWLCKYKDGMNILHEKAGTVTLIR